MITIYLAGLVIAIDNRYDFSHRVSDWICIGEPRFTVRVSEEELELEDEGRGLSREYLEFICAYRHIAERLPEYDAFVFHGAAVAMNGRAYLFTAPSGTGKSTHVAMWKCRYGWRAWCLNGDKPILRKSPEGFMVCGTPWKGKEEFGVNACLPIQAICLLHRGSANTVEPAAPEELSRFLMRQIYLPQDPERMEKLIALIDECCRTVPTWSMYCNRSRRAAEAAYEAMKPQ